MKPYHKMRLAWLGTIFFCSHAIATDQYLHPIASDGQTIVYSSNDIANHLNWKTVPITSQNLCGGYFAVPPQITNTPSPPSIQKTVTDIHTQGSMTFTEKNGETEADHVTVIQPGRIITADKGYLLRDSKTHHISQIEFSGNVSLEEINKRAYGTHGFLDLKKDTLRMDHVVYHLYRPATASKQLSSDGWGTADSLTRTDDGIFHFKNAAYTTCSPLAPTWKMHSQKLDIDKKNNQGVARQVKIDFQHVPILYSPYYSFPLNRVRKSGFLIPSIGYSDIQGGITSIPYYFNLAPNYDLTVTPRIMTNNGVLFNNLFRYITNDSSGSAYLNFIPDDAGFKKFRSQELKNAANFPSGYQPYLKELKSDSDDRAYFALNHHTQFDAEWSSNLHLNYVTDPYYFQNYVDGVNNQNFTSQLLNQADIDYAGSYWNFTALTQAFQTLHQINMPGVSDVYRRLPEFDLNGENPHFLDHFDVGVNNQWVNFTYASAFPPQTPAVGQRLNVAPFMNIPMNWSSGYFTPGITLENTDYETNQLAPGQPANVTRNIPLYNVDTGLYFDRDFSWFGNAYKQTIEPRLFYLNVPYQSQSNLPIYDTILLPFDYSQLFSTNSFSGIDRIQNANQLTLGLSTSVYDDNTGGEKLDAGIGVINYFETPKVCLGTGNCPLPHQQYSPIAGQLTFFPWQNWSTTISGAWDTYTHQIANTTGTLTYASDSDHIASFGYTFLHSDAGPLNDTKFLSTGFSLPLSTHWHYLNYVYFNVTQHYPQNFLNGLEYNTCGWLLRFVAQRSYQGLAPGSTTTKTFGNTYYMQFSLKGLGGMGTAAPQDMLANIPGYQDPFAMHY